MAAVLVSSRAVLRLLCIIVTSALVACATPNDVRYTATYSNIGPTQLELLALDATVRQGYEIAKFERRVHDFAFITLPLRLDPSETVDVAFLVQLVYDVESQTKKRFTVVVVPRPFRDDREVPESELPPTATLRARALSDAIRAHARTYEAPR